jgi:hypothetical protein
LLNGEIQFTPKWESFNSYSLGEGLISSFYKKTISYL